MCTHHYSCQSRCHLAGSSHPFPTSIVALASSNIDFQKQHIEPTSWTGHTLRTHLHCILLSPYHYEFTKNQAPVIFFVRNFLLWIPRSLKKNSPNSRGKNVNFEKQSPHFNTIISFEGASQSFNYIISVFHSNRVLKLPLNKLILCSGSK
jgi:hypothetical protein